MREKATSVRVRGADSRGGVSRRRAMQRSDSGEKSEVRSGGEKKGGGSEGRRGNEVRLKVFPEDEKDLMMLNF